MAFVIQDTKDDKYVVTAKTSVVTPEFSRRFNSGKQAKAYISSNNLDRKRYKVVEKELKDQLFSADEIKRLCRLAVSRMCKEENGASL